MNEALLDNLLERIVRLEALLLRLAKKGHLKDKHLQELENLVKNQKDYERLYPED